MHEALVFLSGLRRGEERGGDELERERIGAREKALLRDAVKGGDEGERGGKVVIRAGEVLLFMADSKDALSLDDSCAAEAEAEGRGERHLAPRSAKDARGDGRRKFIVILGWQRSVARVLALCSPKLAIVGNVRAPPCSKRLLRDAQHQSSARRVAVVQLDDDRGGDDEPRGAACCV